MEEAAGGIFLADLIEFLELDGEFGRDGGFVFGGAADLLGFAGLRRLLLGRGRGLLWRLFRRLHVAEGGLLVLRRCLWCVSGFGVLRLLLLILRLGLVLGFLVLLFFGI